MKQFFKQNKAFLIIATLLTILGLAKVNMAHALGVDVFQCSGSFNILSNRYNNTTKAQDIVLRVNGNSLSVNGSKDADVGKREGDLITYGSTEARRWGSFHTITYAYTTGFILPAGRDPSGEPYPAAMVTHSYQCKKLKKEWF